MLCTENDRIDFIVKEEWRHGIFALLEGLVPRFFNTVIPVLYSLGEENAVMVIA
jgi:hypothetical protein